MMPPTIPPANRLPRLLFLVCAVGFLIALRLVLVRHVTFILWPEMILYPWLVSAERTLYRDIAVAYPPLGIIALKTAYQFFGFSLKNTRAIAHALLFGTDISVFALGVMVWRCYLLSIAVTLFFIIWSMGLEGNSLWFETLYTLPFLAAYWSTAAYLRARKVATFSSPDYGLALRY